tara:strand:- start:5575 stop:5907 length:333 start_codon:yes stop_codon:yes gene_type:complete
MSGRTHSPDKWVIVEMDNKGEKVQKILGGWSGGYLDGDSWKLSSGTLETEEEGDYFLFHQHSGSTYKCHKRMQGLTALTGSMLSGWLEQIKDMEGVTMKIVEKIIEEEEE